jgi:hypothetical protein
MIVLIPLLIFIAFVALVLLQWRKADIARRAEEARAQTIERLADRFGDGDAFLEFARSREGRLLLGARDPVTETGKRLLLAAQAAVLLAALGIGFIATVITTPANADINLIRAAEEAKYWGTFCLALAAGLAVAFWISQERARAWGLLSR